MGTKNIFARKFYTKIFLHEKRQKVCEPILVVKVLLTKLVESKLGESQFCACIIFGLQVMRTYPSSLSAMFVNLE